MTLRSGGDRTSCGQTAWVTLSMSLFVVLVVAVLSTGCDAQGGAPGETQEGLAAAVALTPIESLGKALFFDKNLSKNRNQSCATCHDPAVGYAGGSTVAASQQNLHGAVYPGSDAALFGNRKPPAAAYAGDASLLGYDATAMSWGGGSFWDGRATGWELGDPLAEQAKGPFLNPLEMALASAEQLRQRVKEGSYVALFEQVWGVGSLQQSASVVYDRIGLAVAAYERSAEVTRYTSKFDTFWTKARTKGKNVGAIRTSNWTTYRNLGLNDTELYGLALFNDPGASDCARCHSLKAGSKGFPLFTDFTYDNIGLPKNPENPFYANLAYNPAGASWTDQGLGGYLQTSSPATAATEVGKVKVPTLRNVDKRPTSTFVRAYGHNGAFKSLTDIVRFYHCRSMGMIGGMGGGGMGGGGMGGMGMGGMGGMGCGMMGSPEVGQNLASLNPFPMMNISYLVAFLKTLTDA